MNIYKLLLGILIIVLSLIYLIYTLKSAKQDENYRPIILSFDIQIISGILIFLVLGFVMIYRELKYLF